MEVTKMEWDNNNYDNIGEMFERGYDTVLYIKASAVREFTTIYANGQLCTWC
jgi:hypothetical protein